MSGISFRDAKNGWLTGSFGVRPNYWILYRTRDGGRTWINSSLPAPRGYRRDNLHTASPAFFGGDGVLPTSFSFPIAFVLYHSHDGGSTWSPTTPIRTTQIVGRSERET